MYTLDQPKITVVGAGTMGRGIAHIAALCGGSVTLVDLDAALVARAVSQIDQDLAKGVEKGKLSADDHRATLERIHTTTELQPGTVAADFVIEAVPEDMALKKRLFAELEQMVGDETILGTNTSSLSVTEIGQAVRRPQRLIGMHFFNPPHIMTLLEVVRGELTSAQTLEQTLQLGHRLKRDCIVVADSPGFATSRLGIILGLEAMRMLQEGVASAADIDKAMELGYRHPMGPLKLTDLVGLDVRLAISEHLHQEIGEQFRPPAILRRLVRAGKLGKKTGEGFYSWK